MSPNGVQWFLAPRGSQMILRSSAIYNEWVIDWRANLGKRKGVNWFHDLVIFAVYLLYICYIYIAVYNSNAHG